MSQKGIKTDIYTVVNIVSKILDVLF